MKQLSVCLILAASLFAATELAHPKNFNLDITELHKVQYALVNADVQDEFERDTYALSILKAAQECNVDPVILVALIKKESNFNNKKVGKSGEIGLTQIMPKYWLKFLGVTKKQLKNPDTNILSCAKILRYQLDKESGNYKKALRNYNSNTSRGNKYAASVLQISKKLKHG